MTLMNQNQIWNVILKNLPICYGQFTKGTEKNYPCKTFSKNECRFIDACIMKEKGHPRYAGAYLKKALEETS